MIIQRKHIIAHERKKTDETQNDVNIPLPFSREILSCSVGGVFGKVFDMDGTNANTVTMTSWSNFGSVENSAKIKDVDFTNTAVMMCKDTTTYKANEESLFLCVPPTNFRNEADIRYNFQTLKYYVHSVAVPSILPSWKVVETDRYNSVKGFNTVNPFSYCSNECIFSPSLVSENVGLPCDVRKADFSNDRLSYVDGGFTYQYDIKPIQTSEIVFIAPCSGLWSLSAFGNIEQIIKVLTYRSGDYTEEIFDFMNFTYLDFVDIDSHEILARLRIGSGGKGKFYTGIDVHGKNTATVEKERNGEGFVNIDVSALLQLQQGQRVGFRFPFAKVRTDVRADKNGANALPYDYDNLGVNVLQPEKLPRKIHFFEGLLDIYAECLSFSVIQDEEINTKTIVLI